MPPLTLAQVRAAMLQKLKSSLLTEKHAKALRIEPCTEELATSYGVNPAWAGFKIPYFDAKGRIVKDFYRYRFWPESRPSRGFAALAPPSDLRYVQPKGTELHVYMPPLLHSGATWEDVIQDPTCDLCITEGELKAACVCANTPYVMLGLGGVFSWMSKKQQQELIPALEQFNWSKRKVYIIFDSDRSSKPLVQLAASRLARTLTARGAEVLDLFIPPPAEAPGKQGVDDYILAFGPESFAALFEDKESCVPVKMSLALHQMNEEVALIWGGGAAGNVVRYSDALIMKPEKFSRTFYRDRLYINFQVNKNGEIAKPKAESVADAWLEWPYRTRVADVTYAPGKHRITDENEFNVWTDDGVVPRKGSITPFEDLLNRIFPPATATLQQRTWFLRWLAFPLQYPGTKLFSCVLLWSFTGGTGKNLLAETMIPIYGASNCATISSRHLLSDFNSWAEGKQFIIGDEISLDDKRRTSGDLKSMLTSRTIRINRKGIEPYEVPDCANYYLTSNDPVALSLEPGERRTFVHHLPEIPLGDKYGTDYATWLRERNGAAFVKNHLLTLPLGDFAPAAPPPETEAKDELVSQSRGEVDAWTAAIRTDPEKYLVGGNSKFSPNTTSIKPYSIYTPEDLMKLYDPDNRQRTSFRALGLALARAGFRKATHNNGRLGSYRATFWIMNESIPHLTSTQAAKLYIEERPASFVPPSARGGKEEGPGGKRKVQ